MTERERLLFEKCKNEITEKQFLEISRMAKRLKEKGWKGFHTQPEKINGCVLIEAHDTSGNRHLLSVNQDGESIFLPMELGCK